MSRRRHRNHRVQRAHAFVTDEPDIPFDLPVLYEDEHIIVVDKPHFLPTMPRGMWYKSTALMRLRDIFGEDDIVPAHRLDRLTAGIVVFVRDVKARGKYQLLFQNKKARKVYECLAPMSPICTPRYGTVRRDNPSAPFPLERRSHIVKVHHILQAFEEPGEVNAHTRIEVSGNQPADVVRAGYRAYTLYPSTGKTHQLRVHMNALGLPILGDDFYPVMRKRDDTDFTHPLQLVARSLEFIDPYSHRTMRFESRYPLDVSGQSFSDSSRK
ncbi:23S rRNA pseudouridylate synthase [Alloscardovia omnicolens]|uniref:RNA pseudouridylate synthase n=1 Tax=Alloscardovia omnicolens TaxID=419015 RepID=A0A2I1M5G0_9BIFI|nr:23S rRNA pseudouridylate synthase [Alloscardovia omnicolens]PKZ15349.1 23S rRNA pseudouridylate synthase [Alloscardovia omnicolens]